MTDNHHVGNGVGPDAAQTAKKVKVAGGGGASGGGAEEEVNKRVLHSLAASLEALAGIVKEWGTTGQVPQDIFASVGGVVQNATTVMHSAPTSPKPNNPDAVTTETISEELLAYLHELRMTDKDLARVGQLMKSKKTALCSDVEKVRTSVAALTDVGDLKGPNLRMVVLKVLSVLDGRDLGPQLQFFTEIGLRNSDLVKVVSHVELLKANVDEMRERASFLMDDAHVSKKALPAVVAKAPRVLLAKVAEMQLRVEFFCKIGLSSKGLGKIVTSFPLALLRPIEDMQAKYDLLVESGLGDQSSLVAYPTLLSTSLAERCRPRLLFLKKRGMTRDSPTLNLANVMKGTDESFAEGVATSKIGKYLKFKRKLLRASGGVGGGGCDDLEAQGTAEEDDDKTAEAPTPVKKRRQSKGTDAGQTQEKSQKGDEVAQPERSVKKKKKGKQAAGTQQTETE